MVLIMFVFVLGCQNLGIGGKPSQINIDYRTIHTGTEGLTAEFLQNLPPEKIYVDNDYNIGLKLANRGAHDVKEGGGYLAFKTDTYYIKIENPEQAISLNGKSILNPKGEEIIKADYKASTIKQFEKDVEKKETLIFVDLCYKYTTEAVFDVCMDTDIYNLNYREKVCIIKDISSSNQGAPIAVTRVKQNMVPAGDKLKPEFEITVANVGNGIPYKNTISAEKICSSGVEKSSEEWKDVWNSVSVTAEIPNSGLKLECEPSNLRLDKEQTAKCSATEGIDTKIPPYSTVLKINADYGYTTTISKKVEIVKRSKPK